MVTVKTGQQNNVNSTLSLPEYYLGSKINPNTHKRELNKNRKDSNYMVESKTEFVNKTYKNIIHAIAKKKKLHP